MSMTRSYAAWLLLLTVAAACTSARPVVSDASAGAGAAQRAEVAVPATETDVAAKAAAVAVANIPADDVAAAGRALERARAAARADTTAAPAERVRRLTELGLWAEAAAALAAAPRSPAVDLAEAVLRLQQHRYRGAKTAVAGVLEADPHHRGARLLRARLHVQSWELDAVDVSESDPRLMRTLVALGPAPTAAGRVTDAGGPTLPAEQAENAFTDGWLAEHLGAEAVAMDAYRSTLAANPYHRRARLRLARLLVRDNQPQAARSLVADADSLALPLGPDFRREADRVLGDPVS